MLTKIKNRLASEQGFTLIELLVVIVIIGILAAIAVPSYLSFRGKAQTAAAQANVRSAIPAAEAYYQTASTYTGISQSALAAQVPGISPHVQAAASTGSGNVGGGYCIQDSEDGGTTYYSYIGGSTTGMTLASGKTAATIEAGSCATDVTAGLGTVA